MAQEPDLEINKILTLSTGHLTNKTCNTWLPQMIESTAIPAYEKGEFGWLVFAWSDSSSLDEPDYPNDLRVCLAFAQEHDCLWVNFDADGPIVDGLPVYEAW